MRRRRGGFTLLELLIAIGLGALVLVALYSILGSAVRFQVESLRKGSVTGWSLASLTKMSKELEDAQVLVWPQEPPSDTSDYLVACINWSRTPGVGRIDATQPVTVFYYCYDGNADGKLWRYYDVGNAVSCPASSPGNPPALPPCNGGFTPTGQGGADVIAVGVNRLAPTNPKVFALDDDIRGVRVRYTIGRRAVGVPTAGQPDIRNPQFMDVNLGIPLQRQYINTND